MKTTRSILIIILCAVLILLLAAALFLWKNSHYLYILSETLGLNCKKVELKQQDPGALRAYDLYELQNDFRVTFDQSAMLINSEHPLPEDFAPSLTTYKDTDVAMNTAVVDAYAALSQAVTDKTSDRLFVSSAYRTKEEQQALYEEDPATANRPGASEHETGLGIDVYVRYYAGLGFIKSKAGRFVDSNCWQYGFIIRYPSFGKSKTGMKFEPWHIRYVGAPHAKIIYNNRLTLEEYLESLTCGDWYLVDGVLFSRQVPDGDGKIFLPESFCSAVVSPDNTGAYLVTVTPE